MQDAAGSTCGNDFYWWQSRFGEWLQSLRPSWGFDRYYETGKLFPSFWERYEQSLTRRMPAGIPRAALED